MKSQRELILLALTKEFQDYVLDSIEIGLDFGDDLSFLEACMETFLEMKREETETIS